MCRTIFNRTARKKNKHQIKHDTLATKLRYVVLSKNIKILQNMVKHGKTLQQIVAKMYQSRTPPHWSEMDIET